MDDDFGDDEDFGLESFGDGAQLPGSPQANVTSATTTASNGAAATGPSSQPQRSQSNAWSEAGASDLDLYEDMHDGTFASTSSTVHTLTTSALPSPAQSLKQSSSQAATHDAVAATSTAADPPTGDASTGSAVFIGNLQWWTTDAEVESACAAFGHVTSAQFTEDKSNGRSKGYARVHFSDAGAANLCKTGLNGRVLNEKACVVTLAGPGPPPVTASSAPMPPGHPATTGTAAGRGFGRNFQNPGRGGPPPPAPPAFPPGRGQGMSSIGGRPPDMFRPPPAGPLQMMPNGMSAPMMGRGPGMGMGMAMSGRGMGAPPLPHGMMPRGMPNNMQAGLVSPGPGGLRGAAMGSPGAMPGGMMRPPFGNPGGMPSLFTGGAPLSAGMPSRIDDQAGKRKRI